MNNNTVIGIFSALFIFIGSWVLSGVNFCGGTPVTPPDFSFTDGAFKTKNVESYSFQKSGSFLTVPAATNGELKKIAAHFKSNDDRVLSLVGNYYANEKYEGKTNLGQERAEAIKAKLIRYGAPAKKISTSGKKIDEGFEGGKLYNAVIFEGKEKVKEEQPKVVEKKFSVLSPFIVRYEKGTSKPQMTDELRFYLDQAMVYLKENPKKILMVTGYSDNAETSKINKRISEEQARLVRRLLRDVGKVPSNKVKFEGKGQVNEIASNETKEGRALNRRVEITIQ